MAYNSHSKATNSGKISEKKTAQHPEKPPKQQVGQLVCFFHPRSVLQNNYVVQLFRDAGAIIVGTTAMTEFGVTPLGCQGERRMGLGIYGAVVKHGLPMEY